MRQRLRQWRDLPRADRNTLLAMLPALALLSLGLRLFGYARLRRWIERASTHATSRPATQGDIATGERLARLASIAGRHGPVAATCLRQSLLVYGMLRKRGLAPELKLGVRRTNGTFDAHAWVELGGTALGQHTLEHIALQDPLHKQVA